MVLPAEKSAEQVNIEKTFFLVYPLHVMDCQMISCLLSLVPWPTSYSLGVTVRSGASRAPWKLLFTRPESGLWTNQYLLVSPFPTSIQPNPIWCMVLHPILLFSTSAKEFRYLLVCETSQRRGSECAGRGSDPPNHTRQLRQTGMGVRTS